MNERHTASAGQRAAHKFNRVKAAQKKEIAALKDSNARTITAKMGVVRLVPQSRTWLKVQKRLAFRNARLEQLGVKVK